MSKKLSAKQIKQVASIVTALKYDESYLTRNDLHTRCMSAIDGEDANMAAVMEQVLLEVEAWIAASRARYERMAADVTAIEAATSPRPYLHDDLIDNENVTEKGGNDPALTCKSIGYWSAMCSSGGASIADRADGCGIDINALLGYNIS
jgi:hypothetical protein